MAVHHGAMATRLYTYSNDSAIKHNTTQAIKVFSKSLLLRCKNFQRGQQGRLAVTTGLDKVQREVAIMKKVQTHTFHAVDWSVG